jgi:hypothetical protein
VGPEKARADTFATSFSFTSSSRSMVVMQCQHAMPPTLGKRGVMQATSPLSMFIDDRVDCTMSTRRPEISARQRMSISRAGTSRNKYVIQVLYSVKSNDVRCYSLTDSGFFHRLLGFIALLSLFRLFADALGHSYFPNMLNSRTLSLSCSRRSPVLQLSRQIALSALDALPLSLSM